MKTSFQVFVGGGYIEPPEKWQIKRKDKRHGQQNGEVTQISLPVIRIGQSRLRQIGNGTEHGSIYTNTRCPPRDPATGQEKIRSAVVSFGEIHPNPHNERQI